MGFSSPIVGKTLLLPPPQVLAYICYVNQRLDLDVILGHRYPLDEHTPDTNAPNYKKIASISAHRAHKSHNFVFNSLVTNIDHTTYDIRWHCLEFNEANGINTVFFLVKHNRSVKREVRFTIEKEKTRRQVSNFIESAAMADILARFFKLHRDMKVSGSK